MHIFSLVLICSFIIYNHVNGQVFKWRSHTPTLEPTYNPTIAPTLPPSFETASITTSESICNTECSDTSLHWMQIKVTFWFAQNITYDLTDIECFIHRVFIEWLDTYGIVASFEPCDIDVTYIHGGNQNEHSCAHPPCISNKIRRRLLPMDGNTTMTVTTKKTELAESLESVSLESGEQRFVAQYLQHFALAMTVHITVEPQQKDKDKDQHPLVEQFLELLELHPLWYVVMGLAVLICCIGCVVMCRCLRNMASKEHSKAEDIGSKEEEYKDTKSTITNRKISVSSTVDYAEQEVLHKLRAKPKAAPAIKRENSDSLEMMTMNKIHLHRGVNQDNDEESDDNIQTDNDGDGRKRDATESAYPELPTDMPNNVGPYNDYNAIASPVNEPPIINAPWSAPGPTQAADIPANNMVFSAGADMDRVASGAFSPYDDNPYAQYLQPEMAEFYNAQYNQDNDQQNIQAIENEDTGDDTDGDVNTALVSNDVQPRKRSVEDSADSSGSSWNTTHEESAKYDPLVFEKQRKRTESRRTKRKEDKEVGREDKLQEMIVNVEPIGADSVEIDLEDILEDDTDGDVNTALVSNDVQPRKRSVEDSADSSGSSWNTTHEESAKYDPLVFEKQRKRTESRRTKRKEDKEVGREDKLQEMIVNVEPIGADSVEIDLEDILEDESNKQKQESGNTLATVLIDNPKSESVLIPAQTKAKVSVQDRDRVQTISVSGTTNMSLLTDVSNLYGTCNDDLDVLSMKAIRSHDTIGDMMKGSLRYVPESKSVERGRDLSLMTDVSNLYVNEDLDVLSTKANASQDMSGDMKGKDTSKAVEMTRESVISTTSLMTDVSNLYVNQDANTSQDMTGAMVLNVAHINDI
eukprot:818809_1